MLELPKGTRCDDQVGAKPPLKKVEMPHAHNWPHIDASTMKLQMPMPSHVGTFTPNSGIQRTGPKDFRIGDKVRFIKHQSGEGMGTIATIRIIRGSHTGHSQDYEVETDGTFGWENLQKYKQLPPHTLLWSTDASCIELIDYAPTQQQQPAIQHKLQVGDRVIIRGRKPGQESDGPGYVNEMVRKVGLCCTITGLSGTWYRLDCGYDWKEEWLEYVPTEPAEVGYTIEHFRKGDYIRPVAKYSFSCSWHEEGTEDYRPTNPEILYPCVTYIVVNGDTVQSTNTNKTHSCLHDGSPRFVRA